MRRFIKLLFLGMLLIPLPALAKQSFIEGKFSPGGYSLTLSADVDTGGYGAFWSYTQVNYCDGTKSRQLRQPWGLFGYRGLTFSSEKPMQRVQVWGSFGERINSNDYWGFLIFVRDCNDPAPDAPFFCNLAEIERSFSKEQDIQIQFKSYRHVRVAGLRFVGVPELVPVTQLDFKPSDRSWTGIFDSHFIPAGQYMNVSLVLQDEFDRQTKCRVGSLTVLP